MHASWILATCILPQYFALWHLLLIISWQFIIYLDVRGALKYISVIYTRHIKLVKYLPYSSSNGTVITFLLLHDCKIVYLAYTAYHYVLAYFVTPGKQLPMIMITVDPILSFRNQTSRFLDLTGERICYPPPLLYVTEIVVARSLPPGVRLNF